MIGSYTNNFYFIIKDNNVIIDADSINISEIFEINSNTKGVLFPRMTKAPNGVRIPLSHYYPDAKSGWYV